MRGAFLKSFPPTPDDVKKQLALPISQMNTLSDQSDYIHAEYSGLVGMLRGVLSSHGSPYTPGSSLADALKPSGRTKELEWEEAWIRTQISEAQDQMANVDPAVASEAKSQK